MHDVAHIMMILDIHKCLADELLSQGYIAFKKSFMTFYGRYQDLIEKYQR